jgi:D-inositol-3-phosphate glycosyltransferase
VNHLLFSYHTCPMEEPGAGLSGGMNVFLRGLLPALAAEGIRTDVLTRGKGREPEITLPFPGVRILHLPCGWREPPTRESAYASLPRFVRSVKDLLETGAALYDAVSAHYWMSGISCLDAGVRLPPPVFSYHTVEALKGGAAPAPAPGLSAVRRAAEGRLSREAFRLVCFSRSDLARTVEIFPSAAGKGEVIPPGVDRVFRAPPPREEERRKRGIPSGCFLFLLAARKDPGKNVEAAIEAFRALRAEEGERLRLLVAGQNLPLDRLPDGIACAGPVPHAEMPGLLAAADAVLCPSSYESFGLVPLEAMAAGRPVVAPWTGFWGDTIRAEGGGAGYAPDAPSGIIDAMRAVCRDEALRARLAGEGVTIAARFTWEKCTTAWAELLSSAARSGSPR